MSSPDSKADYLKGGHAPAGKQMVTNTKEWNENGCYKPQLFEVTETKILHAFPCLFTSIVFVCYGL